MPDKKNLHGIAILHTNAHENIYTIQYNWNFSYVSSGIRSIVNSHDGQFCSNHNLFNIASVHAFICQANLPGQPQ